MQEQTLSTAYDSKEPLQGLDTYIEKLLSDWNAPGLALAIVKDDVVVLAKGCGVRRAGEETPIDEHTVFGVGSVTKAFTAAAVALLVDERKVQWDDPVIKHLPDFQLYDPYVTRELTVKDLLCARSGLNGGDMLAYGTGYTRDEIVYRLRYLKPTLGFRAAQGSYTFMFLVAGQLVAALTGQSWDEFVLERILKPLGMSSSYTTLDAILHLENVITPHARIDGKLQPISWDNTDNVGPGGSLKSTAVDLAQWLRLHLGEGTYNGARLLSSEVVREMHSPQIISNSYLSRLFHPEALFINYGLGWYVADYRGRKILNHGGATNGMGAFIAMLPQEHLGLIITSNVSFTSQMFVALQLRVFDAYLGAPERDWSAEFLPMWKGEQAMQEEARAKRERQRIPGTKPSLALEQYAGTYEDTFYGEVTVKWENEKLVFRYGSAFVGELEHWHYDTFKAAWQGPFLGTSLVTFSFDMYGKIDGVKVPYLAEFKRKA